MSLEMADYSPEKKSGCVSMLFHRTFWRRSASTGTMPTTTNTAIKGTISPSTSKRRRGGSDEAAFLNNTDNGEPPGPFETPMLKAPSNQPKTNPAYQYQVQNRKPTNVNPRTPPNQGLGQGQGQGPGRGQGQGQRQGQGQGQGQGRRPKDPMIPSSELDSMINDHQRSKGSNNLIRASSGNVMLYGNLGNLRQPGGGNSGYTSNASTNVLDYLPKPVTEKGSTPNGRYSNNNNNTTATTNTTTNGIMGSNVAKKTQQAKEQPAPQSVKDPPTSLCRAISTRMDPEQLKVMGNEDYKEGRFAEALALYDAAIAIDPGKASYRSNKSAALTALGRLLEAIFECREAIKIDPYYHKAHHRLATLYFRLGEVEKALYHYRQSGPEVDTNDIPKAQSLQAQLNKCTKAKRLRDWNTLLKETEHIISLGSDSAPQIFALQAEALLKLHRHQDADATLSKGPNFDMDDCTKFFGSIGYANLLVVWAQVHMAVGRFDDAVTAAQWAAQLDSNNKEVFATVRRTRGVASARMIGNEHFKASRFKEASMAYGEGLEHDPFNSVLLCNRAACRSKLGQYGEAIEDCTIALNVRPSYIKARLRRADCNAKMERWEASIKDYEILKEECPEDEEVNQALSEARAKFDETRGREPKGPMDVKPEATNVVIVTDNDHFRDTVKVPGICLVFFCDGKSGDREAMQLMEKLFRKHAAVKFFKVKTDHHPQLARSEGATSVPVFKIYKNGSRVKEIPGTAHELLESTVKFYDI